MENVTKENNLTKLRLISENPILNITVGFLLMVTGLLECLEQFNIINTPIGVHHGAGLFGFVQFLKWLPDTFKGLQFVEHGDEKAARLAHQKKIDRASITPPIPS
jgi:hypothetical protein